MIVIVIGLALPIVPVTKTAAVPYVSNQESSVPLFQISSYTIDGAHWVYQSASPCVGEDVAVNLSASNTVDVYLFSSTHYAAYSGQSNPNSMDSQTGSQSGTISFHVSASGTYYLVIYNPHNGLLGLGGAACRSLQRWMHSH